MQNHQRTAESTNDEVLVTQAQEGDNTAFEKLVDRYYNSCLKLATSILRDFPDAEDEVQNACWKAYAHIGQYQGDAKFSTWLTRIVVNQCLMRLRQHRRSRLIYLEDTLGEDFHMLDLPSQELSPEVELGKIEIAELVENEVNRLPPLLRNVLLLRDIQELAMEDVADRLGISLAAAKSRLIRARVELRNRLRKHEGRMGLATLFD